MKMLVIGSEGQVARALAEKSRYEILIRCVGRPQANLTDRESLERIIGETKPDIVVNAAAYTAVDNAENETDIAFAVNKIGAGNLAAVSAIVHCPIIHLSTDYIFPGNKTRPYIETDAAGPLSVYGRSKLEGEFAVAEANAAHVILRTSWIYAPWGHNFAKTMLRLAETHEVISVVDDQQGTPTYAPDIADGILMVACKVLNKPRDASWRGIFHMTSQGSTTWARFAEAIFAASAAVGGPTAKVERIDTSKFQTRAKRPSNSRLDTTKFENTFEYRLPPWEAGIGHFITSLKD